MDVRTERLPDREKQYDVVSCMFGLNYMNHSKGELANWRLMCDAATDGATVLMIYAGWEAVRAFKSTDECEITPLLPDDWSSGYNFKLGSLVNAVEYEVDRTLVDAVMEGHGLRMLFRRSLLALMGDGVNWITQGSGRPLTSAIEVTILRCTHQ